MHLPSLEPGKYTLETRDFFVGLNRSLRLRPGEFYDMENLSSDLLPVMSQRKQRAVVKTGGSIQGLACKDGLCYVDGSALYLNGQRLDLKLSEDPTLCPKQLISMGAYLIILPDKVYVNTADPQDFGSLDASFTTAGPALLCQCSLDGTEIKPEYVGKEVPENPGDHSYWLDYDRGELKQYAKATDLWLLVETPYVKLQYPGLGKHFSRYDGVKISGDPALREAAGQTVLYGCGEDYLVFPGLLREKTTLSQPVTVSRKMPRVDYCVESGNRLWACRYGPNEAGQVVNEIYCSKLGDFKNWNCYLGISTDSYTVSLGSDGPFTGAATLGGYPIFFKENYIHKVFGQMPSNFQVQSTPCRGVREECSGSLAVVNEVLYYKSRGGVCAYDGSLPREISQPLGDRVYDRAVGAGIHGKYYVSMEYGNHWELLVYDTLKNVWHREDGLRARLLCPCREELFCVDGEGRLLALLGTVGEKEEKDIPWMAESGIIGISLPGNKYLGKLSLRMLMEPGSTLTVRAQYDSIGPWESLGTVRGMNLHSFSFPVLPRRCDHLRLRLEGRGRALLFSVTAAIRPGSF